MKLVPLTAAMLLAVGCVPPAVEIRSAPEPAPQALAETRNLQIRMLPITLEAVFPRVIEVLMDNGYIVRSVNEKLGTISFHQQWLDTSQMNANIVQEGSALFQAAGPSSTQVRVVLTGSWQRAEVSGGGKHSIDTAMFGGVQQSASPQELKRLLDLFEKGLSTPRP